MGGGVLGTAICRELTHRGVETMLLENRWVWGTKNGVTDGTVPCALFGGWCFPYIKPYPHILHR